MTENNRNRHICTGLMAHVDSGKTTLSEALLYASGTIRKLGKVDTKDAFLDTDARERDRGITIFSKQAELTWQGMELTLLDTPGHVDFSAEMERVLQVLDYAVLLISGADGVQGHTRTLWNLLARYQVPTFIFINKMDQDGTDRQDRLTELKRKLSGECVDFTEAGEEFLEELSMCDETVMESYLENGEITASQIQTLIRERKVFPCYFGSALKLEGVQELLDGLEKYMDGSVSGTHAEEAFGAKVYKISRDSQGSRLTHVKITNGVLKVKEILEYMAEEEPMQEKVNQIRIYSGDKYEMVQEAEKGCICAVTGLTRTYSGQGLGMQQGSSAPVLEPVLNYRVELPEGADPHYALLALRTLEDEDPQLHVVWNAALGEIHLQLMGEIQLEILQSVLQSRFGLEVAFGEGGILYKETISAPVEGVGHYEPLRHYAEVHLLLEPGEPGSGLQFASICRTDALDLNWQRLILTHLAERSHPGALAGAPLTDVKITLTAGRAHIKHTEGGDFRQATYRAVRQGLRTAAARGQAVLLEPWYDFRLEVPQDCVGRAMADLQRRCAEFSTPENEDGLAVITGKAPVAEMRGCAREVTAYTRGAGRLSCMPRGYAPCHNTEAVLEAIGYQPDADTENPADSVFCSHGAGYLVKWDEVPAHAHVASGLGRNAPGAQQAKQEEADASDEASDARRRAAAYCGTLEQDKELLAIFERTYGPIKRRGEAAGQHDQLAARKAFRSVGPSQNRTPAAPPPSGPEYLLVDGYNVIFAWDELKKIAAENLDAARRRLMDILCNYAGYRKCVPILVFDAYRVKGAGREQETWHNLHVIYTREAETADMFIERATHELAKNHRVRVVSSDGAEQIIILGNGALRVSARAFEREVRAVEAEIREFLDQ